MQTSMSRRGALKTFGALAAGGSVSALAGWAATTLSTHHGPRRKALRIAHLTDIHVHPNGPSGRGLAACLRHVQSQWERPSLILNGGDAVLDARNADEDETRAQWKLWQSVLRNECLLPVEHCLGNHDFWGGSRKGAKTSAADQLYGKQWAMDEFGMSEPYRSFTRSGWHFVILNSILPHGDDYKARLDDEQFAWLQADLQATAKTTPILLLSHIPIVSACALFDGDNEESGNWVVPGAWIHLDARRLKNLFLQHPNVKVCLSGHIHLRDRIDINGVTYLCNGAVSGNWWRGAYQECQPGYALLDLYDDGSFEHQYVTY
jgi:predicted MPP superfamily phosphohydrolase